MSHYFIFFYPVTIITLFLTYSAPVELLSSLTGRRIDVDVDVNIRVGIRYIFLRLFL